MNFINFPTPVLNAYQRSNPIIEFTPIGIHTTVIKCLKDYFTDENAWYCFLTTDNSLVYFDIRNVMGEDVFNKVINKELTVVFDMSFEPFLKCIDSIYEHVVKKHNIPSTQIMFVSNMYDAHDYNNKIAKQLNIAPVRIVWIPTLEYMISESGNAIKYMRNLKTLEIKHYEKKFLNLNRRWRTHRPMLTLLLKHHNLLDSGFISFGPCEDHSDWNKVIDWLKVTAIGNQEMFDAILAEQHTINDLKPLYLDLNDLSINQVEPTSEINKYYENSYFSVVSETTFYYKETHQNSRFLTEKTFKAILSKHPFILVTIPNSLSVLKELGYKTFSPWIDESYDIEMDDNKRMMMILKEIQRLCNLDENDLMDFLSAMNQVCEYNYHLLLKKKTPVIERT